MVRSSPAFVVSAPKKHCSKPVVFITPPLKGRRYFLFWSDSIHCAPCVLAYGSNTALHHALMFDQGYGAIFIKTIWSRGPHPTAIPLQSCTNDNKGKSFPWPTVYRLRCSFNRRSPPDIRQPRSVHPHFDWLPSLAFHVILSTWSPYINLSPTPRVHRVLSPPIIYPSHKSKIHLFYVINLRHVHSSLFHCIFIATVHTSAISSGHSVT